VRSVGAFVLGGVVGVGVDVVIVVVEIDADHVAQFPLGGLFVVADAHVTRR
jgi:hypothetical protein